MWKSRKTKKLESTIEDLTRRIEVLEFKEKAKGEKYIAELVDMEDRIWNRHAVKISFIHDDGVKTEIISYYSTSIKEPKVVGNFVEIYEYAFGSVDTDLYAVYTQLDDKIVSVNVDVYKKAVAYDELTKNDDKEKNNGT